jgi:hypothetical protein
MVATPETRQFFNWPVGYGLQAAVAAEDCSPHSGSKAEAPVFLQTGAFCLASLTESASKPFF